MRWEKLLGLLCELDSSALACYRIERSSAQDHSRLVIKAGILVLIFLDELSSQYTVNEYPAPRRCP